MKMEDSFEETKASDILPITKIIRNGGESTPLKGSLARIKDKVVGEDKSSGELSHQKNDSVGKYKNLESETSEQRHADQLNEVQLRFGPGYTSTWSLNSSSASTSLPPVSWYKHPKVREHWKIVAASFVLFFIGLCLCIAGIVLEALNVDLNGIFMLFVIGSFCFIPGLYHMIAVYYAVKGKRGFSFYNLPLFN